MRELVPRRTRPRGYNNNRRWYTCEI